jgi:hypothetical protein
MSEEQLGLIAQGTTRWIERWYGSEPMKGSSIITVNHDEIAVIGGDKETHRQVRKVVMAHNAALESLDTERTRADKAEQRERELREAVEMASKCALAAFDANGLAEPGPRAMLRALIQPEPDPLVGLIADIKAEIARQRETRGDYLDYGQPDTLLVRALAALSIVKGES